MQINKLTGWIGSTRIQRAARANSRGLALAAACLVAFGCGAPADVEEGEGAADLELAADPTNADESITVLQEFSVEDQTFSFRLIAGIDGREPSVLLVDQGASIDRRALLAKEYGLLTSLEVFWALAPEGLEPHAELIAAHPREALSMGRNGEELAVRLVDGRGLNVDKAVRATCEADVLFDIRPLRYEEKQKTEVGIDNQTVFTCAGDPKVSNFGGPSATTCERIASSKMVVLGLCNDLIGADVQARLFVDGLARATPDIVSRGEFIRYVSNISGDPFGRRLAIQGKNGVEVHNFHVQHTGVGVR